MGEADVGRNRAERLSVSSARQTWTVATARTLRHDATPSEMVLWERLRGRRLDGFRFRRQQPIGPYVADFFCSTARLVVEVDGGIHDHQADYDAERHAQLEGAGYRVLRVAADSVIHDVEHIVQEIRIALATPPPLPRQGEGVGR